ncbi:MAG TPA: nuclear transport factor 2 family protein, partial [Capillimicrobium sp.]
MDDDEQEIRALIQRWAEAVHRGDLATVLDAHAEDIVMFDVPPPHGGVRGLDAYRATWPPFFDWQASGGQFELTELEVVAGGGVAYAWALLRCSTREHLAQHPEHRL